MPEAIDIVFTAPPGPANECVFVEVEQDGRSIDIGEWIERPDGLWALRIPTHAITATVQRGRVYEEGPEQSTATVNVHVTGLLDAEELTKAIKDVMTRYGKGEAGPRG